MKLWCVSIEICVRLIPIFQYFSSLIYVTYDLWLVPFVYTIILVKLAYESLSHSDLNNCISARRASEQNSLSLFSAYFSWYFRLFFLIFWLLSRTCSNTTFTGRVLRQRYEPGFDFFYTWKPGQKLKVVRKSSQVMEKWRETDCFFCGFQVFFCVGWC